MSEQRHDYLWDRSGPMDDEAQAVAELEELLGTLRTRRPMPALDAPASPRARANKSLSWLLVAAGFMCLVWGWIARVQNHPGPAMAQLPALDVPAIGAASGAPGWRVSVLRGSPTCDGASLADDGELRVGGWIETRTTDEARLAIGTIGELRLGPDSRLRLLSNDPGEQRVRLERGSIHAFVDAPPRMFLVDTPATTAVDLGCEYNLVVLADGAVSLSVATGWVALESAGQPPTYVPAGFSAVTSAAGRASLPWRTDAAAALIAAVRGFDRDDPPALTRLLSALGADDLPTAWHLLAVGAARARVFDRMLALGAPRPSDSAPILGGDANALKHWGEQLGVAPPPGWPAPPPSDHGPPDRPAPVWSPNDASPDASTH